MACFPSANVETVAGIAKSKLGLAGFHANFSTKSKNPLFSKLTSLKSV
jgi:hypothetical protein